MKCSGQVRGGSSGQGGGVGVVAEEHGGGSFGEPIHVGTKVRQYGVGTRDRIGEGQGQFSTHHRRGRVCHGSDGEKE